MAVDRKVRIRRDPNKRTWTVQPPTFGFGEPQPREFPDWKTALRWADQRIQRSSVLFATLERAPRRDIAAVVINPYWQ